MIAGVASRWRAAILICGKCEKKLHGSGFGTDGDQRLSKLLKKRAGGGKGRKAAIGIVRTGCLKICPRNAVTLLDGARPRDWLVVHRGTPIEEVELRLNLLQAPISAGPN